MAGTETSDWFQESIKKWQNYRDRNRMSLITARLQQTHCSEHQAWVQILAVRSHPRSAVRIPTMA